MKKIILGLATLSGLVTLGVFLTGDSSKVFAKSDRSNTEVIHRVHTDPEPGHVINSNPHPVVVSQASGQGSQQFELSGEDNEMFHRSGTTFEHDFGREDSSREFELRGSNDELVHHHNRRGRGNN